jgi:hypothetical protein
MDGLIRIRQVPAVAHPRHAREALAAGDDGLLTEWVGGYAVTVPEHRHLLEDLFASLAWGEHGAAVLLNGLYGTGKSHLLILLHLLAARPEAWDAFLTAHPEFRRYAEPMGKTRRLVVHFALDEYGPKVPLEEALGAEVARALGVPFPAGGSRLDAWAAVLDACRMAGYDGLLLLVDELSLFLAAKSPAAREADAAFLQFLAGWTGRAPVWLIGALQRHLSDVGALRSHSWRQVEDRFRRYTLSPQQLGDVLRERLLERRDPAAIRTLVAAAIIPAAEGLPLSARALQEAWPFHPDALTLLLAVVNAHLSPHRGAVEVFLKIGQEGLAREAGRLFTPLDLFARLEADLRRYVSSERLWRATALLDECSERAADPPLARHLVRLLTLLHLADHTATVGQLRALLFDGIGAPAIEELSATLHALRRQGAYLAAVRDADPALEVFTLAVEDDAGALALALMEARRAEFSHDDPRILEAAFTAGTDPAWPFTAWLGGQRLSVPWRGSERTVACLLLPALSREAILRQAEAIAAGQNDGAVLCLPPGQPAEAVWHEATALVAQMPTLLLWLPRTLTPVEGDLLAEFAAWSAAAEEANPPGSGRERRARTRCRERAEELRPAVQGTLYKVYLDGHWHDAAGGEGQPAEGASLVAVLAEMLSPAFEARYPLFPALADGGAPSRAAAQQLLLGFIEPGQAVIGPQSLLGDYLERFASPLGCVQLEGAHARVTPPRWELLEPLLAGGPWRLAEALDRLGQPPLGLTHEQARLAVLAAVRAGALQGLDAFLQPLDPETTPLARSDALAFLAPPAQVEARHTALVRALAVRWEIPLDPWPLACSQVERRLREWVRSLNLLLPEVRAAMAAWSEALGVMPWAWEATERLLDGGDRLLAARQSPLSDLLDVPVDEAVIDGLATVQQAAAWWRRHGRQATVLCAALPGDAAPLRAALAAGERGFPELEALGAQMERLWAAYRDAYLRWHEETYGADAVHALRTAFDSPAFKAVKALTRLPLPPPEGAVRGMDALARARAGYCPGLFGRLDEEGACGRCRLPLGASSPMPDAVAITVDAADALRDYALLLAESPWTTAVRDRLPRAPEGIAEQVSALFGWHAGDDPATLLAALDEPTLAWLARDEPPAAVRHLATLHDRLHGRDLTLGEAKGAVARWLNPEGQLSDDAVIEFS